MPIFDVCLSEGVVLEAGLAPVVDGTVDVESFEADLVVVAVEVVVVVVEFESLSEQIDEVFSSNMYAQFVSLALFSSTILNSSFVFII